MVVPLLAHKLMITRARSIYISPWQIYSVSHVIRMDKNIDIQMSSDSTMKLTPFDSSSHAIVGTRRLYDIYTPPSRTHARTVLL